MAKDKATTSTAGAGAKDVKFDNGAQGNGTVGADGIWQDKRFQHLLEDPRFRGVPKLQRKVKIDKRFQGMFTDDRFKVKYTVDKYGRRVNKSNAEDLRKYYEIEDSTDEEAESTVITQTNEKEAPTQIKVKQRKNAKKNAEKYAKPVEATSFITTEEDDEAAAETEERRAEELAISRQDGASETVDSDGNDALESDGELVPKSIRERLLDPSVDYARGEGRLVTDSSSDDESSEDDEGPELQIDHVWGELDAEAETTEESTRRLAVCNMDWDRIRANDLMILFSSFLPPGGSVLSIRIYPSEFGKARMAEEDVHGPNELIGKGDDKAPDDVESIDSDEDSIENGREQDSDVEEGDNYHMEKLRQYQLNRLRYYYAVVECDTVATADKLYKECDGIEYESSATRVDLRYVPDDTTFDEDEPTDVCTELPELSSYKPRQFTTTALQQAKVDLTWDETALERRELGDKLSSCKLADLKDKDLRQIVAYSSEEEEEEEVEANNEKTNRNVLAQTGAEEIKENPMSTKPNKKEKLKASIAKYQALLTEIKDNEQKQKKTKNFAMDMEMTWDVTADVKQEKEQQEALKETSTKEGLTPIEKVLQKRSEKNKKRKEDRRRRKLEAAGIDPDAVNNMDDDDSVPDGIDLNDAYFAEEFANGDFEEPANNNQKSKAQNKLKSRKKQQIGDEESEEAQHKTVELELLLDDCDDLHEGKQHFSLDKIMKAEQDTATSKRKRRKQLKKAKNTAPDTTIKDDFEVDVADPRFNAVYSSHMFNIDPTHSHYKKTKGMEQIIQEKLKRRHEHSAKPSIQAEAQDLPESKRPKKQLENSILVKSLKRKIQMKQSKN